jgi:GDSL-like lipase/acylhydrolase family protein
VSRKSAVPAFAAVVAMYLVVSGCGSSSAVQAADRSAPAVAIDHHLDEPAQWGSPKVSRTSDGGFVARLSPDAAGGSGGARGPVQVSLGGLGWPRTGEGFGDQPYVGPAILSRWTGNGETYTVSLTTSARYVTAVVWNIEGRFQVRVGSTAVGVPRLIGTANHHHDLDVDFTTSARRTITFELAGAVYFSGLKVGGGSAQVSRPNTPRPPPPSTYWLGDSYVAGGGSTHPGFDDLAHLASSRAGLTDVTVDALGDTGYVRTNVAAHFPAYLTRARLNLGGRRARPQLVVVGGSINDAVFGEARVRRAAAALYGYLRHALPAARVVVVTFASGYPAPGAEAAANQGILRAARAAPNVVGVLDVPARIEALAGAAGAARRSGALESRAIQGHPSELGHQVYGRIIGTFLADCLSKLKDSGASPGVCDQRS